MFWNSELTAVPRPDVKLFDSHKLVYPHELFAEPEQTIRTNDPFPPIRYMTDLKKFFLNDKYGYDVRELKFLARMVTDDPFDKSAQFLVRWFMEDDTMNIRFLDLKSSNKMEHKCLRRMRVVKPRSSEWNYERWYYEPKDMYVGNVIYARGRAYELLEADEYTYDYMERNCDVFLHSNIKSIMARLKLWAQEKYGVFIEKFEALDTENSGLVAYDKFKEALYSCLPNDKIAQYPEHAIKTLARHYSKEKYVGLKFDDLAARMRTELYRMKFYDFDELKLAMELQDEEKTGCLEPNRVYYSMRCSSIPVNRDLMKNFIFKFPKTNGKIRYTDLIHVIDWQKDTTQYKTTDTGLIPINWQHIETEKDMNKIQYKTFLQELLA